MIGAYILLIEWTRALASSHSGAAVASIVLGSAALALTVLGWPAARLGLGTSRLGLRIFGGFALAAVLYLVYRAGEDRVRVKDIQGLQDQMKRQGDVLAGWRQESIDANAKLAEDVGKINAADRGERRSGSRT